MSPDLVAGRSVNKRLGERRGAKKRERRKKRVHKMCVTGRIETNSTLILEKVTVNRIQS